MSLNCVLAVHGKIWYDSAVDGRFIGPSTPDRTDMNPIFESISPPSEGSFVCRGFTPPAFTFGWHFHPEIELTLIVRGQGKRFVGDDIANFRAGDLCLLGPNLPHTWLSDQPHPTDGSTSESIVIQFLPDCFGAGFFRSARTAGGRQTAARRTAGPAVHRPRARRRRGEHAADGIAVAVPAHARTA